VHKPHAEHNPIIAIDGAIMFHFDGEAWRTLSSELARQCGFFQTSKGRQPLKMGVSHVWSSGEVVMSDKNMHWQRTHLNCVIVLSLLNIDPNSK
jgi:hypothetical protein